MLCSLELTGVRLGNHMWLLVVGGRYSPIPTTNSSMNKWGISQILCNIYFELITSMSLGGCDCFVGSRSNSTEIYIIWSRGELDKGPGPPQPHMQAGWPYFRLLGPHVGRPTSTKIVWHLCPTLCHAMSPACKNTTIIDIINLTPFNPQRPTIRQLIG